MTTMMTGERDGSQTTTTQQSKNENENEDEETMTTKNWGSTMNDAAISLQKS